MILAVSTYSLANWRPRGRAPSWAEKVDRIAALGVKAIEFAGGMIEQKPGPLRRRAEKAGMTVMAHAKDFHIKLAKQAPDTWIPTPAPIALRAAIAGHGNVDIPAQLRALKLVGYKGYLSLEFEGLEEPTFAIKSGLAYLRQQLKKR